MRDLKTQQDLDEFSEHIRKFSIKPLQPVQNVRNNINNYLFEMKNRGLFKEYCITECNSNLISLDIVLNNTEEKVTLVFAISE